MVATSEFIFEGTVIGQEAIRPDGSNNIFTKVTFAVADVLKGDYSASTVSLYFMGGTIGSLTLSISDMEIPKNGERGIYFVESIAKRQVHPLYGWNQGRFLILNDREGNPRVHTAQGKLKVHRLKAMGSGDTNTLSRLKPTFAAAQTTAFRRRSFGGSGPFGTS